MTPLPRRALLAASLAAPTAALAFNAPLRLGANIERWFPIAANGHARRLGRAWWAEFRAAGFDHARLFIPKDSGLGEEVPRLFLDAVEDAHSAGLPVMLALTDDYNPAHPWDAAQWRAVEWRARLFAEATDPALLLLAPLNEPAFGDARAWTPIRDRMLAMCRAAAPRHTLMWGGHEWCSWRSLPLQPPPADRNTVAEVHDYEGGNAAWIAQRFGGAAAWGARHGLRVMVTELGGARPHAENVEAWSQDLRRALPELRRLGLPATLWAITHGGHWRLQEGEGPAPRPRIAQALSAARQ